MNGFTRNKLRSSSARGLLAAAALAAAALAASTAWAASGPEHSVLVLTSTNDPGGNAVVVFKLETDHAPSLSWVNTLPTGGVGGASGNAGIVQFRNDRGAVANFGSNSVTELVREEDTILVGRTIKQASGCVQPDSVALSHDHLFIVGANCAESHDLGSGALVGAVARLTDATAAQIAVGQHWSAVTLKSGSVLQLPLTRDGALSGAFTPISLPSEADNTPLGEDFWGDLLGFTPAHSPDSFAIANQERSVFPVTGPTPPYPTNAPCWVAKGAGNIWYTANSPAQAISIFFSDDQGGIFYKSIPLPGTPTDITVSGDRKWLAIIYSASGDARLAVYSIDGYGGLALAATSGSVGVASFNGVAFSE
jgi:hypothetical protein